MPIECTALTQRPHRIGNGKPLVAAVTAAHCNTLQHTATHCTTLQHSATHCSTLQHITTHCTTLHHTATHVCAVDAIVTDPSLFSQLSLLHSTSLALPTLEIKNALYAADVTNSLHRPGKGKQSGNAGLALFTAAAHELCTTYSTNLLHIECTTSATDLTHSIHRI